MEVRRIEVGEDREQADQVVFPVADRKALEALQGHPVGVVHLVAGVKVAEVEPWVLDRRR